MHVLMIGGGGVVGRSLLPYLSAAHRLTVLDRQPLRTDLADTVVGDATDLATLRTAMEEADAVLHLAAVVPRGKEEHDDARVRAAFEVNVTGAYLALRAAVACGVRRFVHTSTMSVYRNYGRVPIDASLPPDSTQPYGQSKRLAEQLCAAADADGALTATSLRLAVPTTDDLWPYWRSPGAPHSEPVLPALDDGTPYSSLAPADLARAVEAALTREGPYAACAVTGDIDAVTLYNDPTPQVLGWRPQQVVSTGAPDRLGGDAVAAGDAG